MPPVAELLLENDSSGSGSDIEDTKLWLPSELDAVARSTCSGGISTKEEVLHEVQCHDALGRIRSLERVKISMVQFWNINLRGQAQNSRAQEAFAELRSKSGLAAGKYHRA